MGLDLWRKDTKKKLCQSQDSSILEDLCKYFFNSTIKNQGVSQNEW